MGFDIAVKTEDFLGNEDRSWLATRKGTDTCRSATLDFALFNTNHVVNGQIPSGTVLGKVTATGRYGPYDNAATDGRQDAAGLMFNSQRIGNETLATKKAAAVPLFWEGVVLRNKLPLFPNTVLGEIDTAAETDLRHIRFE